MLVKAGITVSSEVNPDGRLSDTAFRTLTKMKKSWIWHMYPRGLEFCIFFFLPKIKQSFLFVSASLG